jgi:hypothetical protein
LEIDAKTSIKIPLGNFCFVQPMFCGYYVPGGFGAARDDPTVDSQTGRATESYLSTFRRRLVRMVGTMAWLGSRYVWGGIAAAVFFFLTIWGLDVFFPTPTYNIAALPRATLGQTIDFRNGQNSGALISGWSGPEPGGVWSEGKEAFIGVVTQGMSGKTVSISFNCGALTGSKWPEQKIEFWSGYTKLSEVSLVKDSDNNFSVPLTGLSLKDGEALILRLKLPLAKSIKDLELGTDTRNLAVAIVSARFDS